MCHVTKHGSLIGDQWRHQRHLLLTYSATLQNWKLRSTACNSMKYIPEKSPSRNIISRMHLWFVTNVLKDGESPDATCCQITMFCGPNFSRSATNWQTGETGKRVHFLQFAAAFSFFSCLLLCNELVPYKYPQSAANGEWILHCKCERCKTVLPLPIIAQNHEDWNDQVSSFLCGVIPRNISLL